MTHNTKELILKIVGRSCRRWRRSMDYKISQIANETGYSPSLIQYFEQGMNNNAVVFLWYVGHGFCPYSDIKTETGKIIDITRLFEMG